MKKLAMIAALCACTAAAAQIPPTDAVPGEAAAEANLSGDVVTDTTQGLTTQADIGTDAQVTTQTPPLDTEADAQIRAQTQSQAMPGDVSAETEAQIQARTEAQTATRGTASADAPLPSAAGTGQVLAQRLDTYRPIARDTYPVCSATVTDNCVQRNDPGGSNVELAAQGSLSANAAIGGPEPEDEEQ